MALKVYCVATPRPEPTFYHAAIGDGWMTIDEVRQLENLPKLPANKFKPAQPPKGAA
jgi:hypothetical protein